jgi:hypothetical protein
VTRENAEAITDAIEALIRQLRSGYVNETLGYRRRVVDALMEHAADPSAAAARG